MSQRTKAQEALGIRLADILTRLNQGETIDIQSLPERYGISLRTMYSTSWLDWNVTYRGNLELISCFIFGLMGFCLLMSSFSKA